MLLLSLLKNEMSRIITIKTLSVIREVQIEVSTLNDCLVCICHWGEKVRVMHAVDSRNVASPNQSHILQ